MTMHLSKIIPIVCLLPFFASAQNSDDSAKFDYYRNGNARGLYYAEILIRNSAENNRLNYEKDFSARAFNYWLLLQNKKIKRDLLVEAHFKKAILLNSIRREIWSDPLGRNQKADHFAASLKFAVTSENYAGLVKDFLVYLEAVKSDAEVPNLE